MTVNKGSRAVCFAATVLLVTLGDVQVSFADDPSFFQLTTTYEYDSKFQVTKTKLNSMSSTGSTELIKAVTLNEYDELGRVTNARRVQSWYGPSANDPTTKYVYDVTGSISKTIRVGETADAVTEYDYDAFGRNVTTIDPVGGEIAYEYDEGGNVTKQSRLVSGTTYADTLMAHDSLGRVTKTTDPAGHYRESSYNSRGLPYKQTAKNSGGTALSKQQLYYDNASRALTTVDFADAAQSSWSETADTVRKTTYDVDGNVLTHTSYNMKSSTPLETINEYDGYGRMTKTTDPGGLHTTMEYDGAQHLTRRLEYDGIGTRTVDLVYDDFDRMTKEIALASDSADDLTTTYTFDVLNRLEQYKDPESVPSSTVHNNLNQVYIKTRGTNEYQTEIMYYDLLGRMVTHQTQDTIPSPSVTQNTIYKYDLAGRRTQVVYPDGGDVDYAFDLAGRMTKRTDQRGVVVDYTYDTRGLLTEKDDGTLIETLSYDGLGRMTLAKKGISGNLESISKTTFVYDDLSRVEKETQELFDEGVNARDIEYWYDQRGSRLTTEYDATGGAAALSLQYEYDDLSINTKVKGLFENGPDNLTSYQDFITYDYQGRNLTRRRLQTLYKLESSYSDYEMFIDRLVEYDQHRFATRISNDNVYNGTTLESVARFDYTVDKVGNQLSKDGYLTTSGNYDGFSKIPKIPTLDYDGLHRVTSVGYDTGSGTQHEDFDYDLLGNRMTYQDHRNSITTAYVNNVANEYSSIEDVPGGGGAVTVLYDPAGNLSRDEDDFEYTYDYENRLTKVTYEGGVGSTQVAHYEYDALGRLISTQLRFDSDTDGDAETLKYYYDGRNVIAEYDPSDNLSRRYIHGTAGVDERAVLLGGDPGGASFDTYYYMLEDLNTVTGVLAKNGQLLEASNYDAYGNMTLYSYHKHDTNRDGGVVWFDDRPPGGIRQANVSTSDPTFDVDHDGDTDDWDYTLISSTLGEDSEVLMRTSGLGNPYFFTGRRLHNVEDLTQSGTATNKQLQYNRARHFRPKHGRWLQRDPIGAFSMLAPASYHRRGPRLSAVNLMTQYKDGMNLYQYARSRSTVWGDPYGLAIGGTPICKLIGPEITGEWSKEYTLILADTYYTPGTGPISVAGATDAYERAIWLQDFRNVYKCQLGCLCFRIYGTVGSYSATTRSFPVGGMGAFAVGLVGDFSLGAGAALKLLGGGALEKELLKVVGDNIGPTVGIFTNYSEGSRNPAPEPLAGAAKSEYQSSGLPRHFYSGSVDCKLNYFKGSILDVGRY